MFEFAELREKLATYLSVDKIELISESYAVAYAAHEGQFRKSGEPYITHPIAVARILANFKLDADSIMAALLHDVMEDSSIDKEFIANKFGDKIAELVDGVTKLDQISFESKIEAQAENLRKMMMAMARDIRVILVKLADRLHNMRTLECVSREKQVRIAEETLEIYAPIASRLGMQKFKIEFENLGFAFLYPVRYKVLQETIEKSRGNHIEIVNEIENMFSIKLNSEKIKFLSVKGREKHLYSLYKKMKLKDVAIQDVSDIYAIRIILENIDDCYRVLGIAHSLFKPVHGRFKDYIAVPKANGYQSLHTTVIGIHGITFEVQIRTAEMDNMAENGVCSHWLYKSFPYDDADTQAELMAKEWLRGLLDIENTTGNSLEFIENVKMDIFQDEVYVFTPGGEILSLAAGATCVDFAFAVHTDVGNSCIAAKIDRKIVPLSTRIMSGQTIEIVNAPGAHPNPAWLGFVVTGKARSNIRHWLRSQQTHEAQNLGKRLLERAMLSFETNIQSIAVDNLTRVLNELKLSSIEQLYIEIGLGNQLAQLVAQRLNIDGLNLDNKTPLAIKGTEGVVINYAKCCKPIPGDKIVGFLVSGKGMFVHREVCSHMDLKKSPEKYVHVEWSRSIDRVFVAELKIDVIDKKGILAIIAGALAECNSNIETLNIEQADIYTTFVFNIHVQNRNHLAIIIKRIRKLDVVVRISRI